MLLNFDTSLERKRPNLDLFSSPRMSKQRKWLSEVLAKDLLIQMLEYMSINRIAQQIGISEKTLRKYAIEVCGIKLHPKGFYLTRLLKNAEIPINFVDYFKKIGKYES